MNWQSLDVGEGGRGGSGAALGGGFGSWTCICCSMAPSHRNKPFLIDGALSPAASQRKRVSGTSVSSERKKKFRLFMTVSYLAGCTFNPPALQPPQPGSALVINDQLSSDRSESRKICGAVLRGRAFCARFSADFVPEFHKAKLKVPRMFSQLVRIHNYHTFHGTRGICMGK